MSGHSSSRSAADVTSSALPRGADGHLCRFPNHQSPPATRAASPIRPGAWAPSTNTLAPAAWATSAIRAVGRMRAVGEVIWSTTTSFVRGPMARVNAATTVSSAAAPTNPARPARAWATHAGVWGNQPMADLSARACIRPWSSVTARGTAP